MDSIFLKALLVGIAIMLAIYISLVNVLGVRNVSSQRAFALFSAAIGLAATLFLADQPALLERYLGEIVAAAVGLTIALLVFLRKRYS